MNRLILMGLLACSLWAQEGEAKDPPKTTTPTDAEVKKITEAVRDYYRLNGQATQLAQQATQARDGALGLKAQIEKKYGCAYNLDTNECVPPDPGPSKDGKKDKDK